MAPLQLKNVLIYNLAIGPKKVCAYTPSLAGPSLTSTAKIYMIVAPGFDGTIYYVGQTSQSIPARFADGFREGNYQWAREGESYTLFVWDVQEHADGTLDLQAIEAELVFAVRIAQRAWPKHQAGIYFRHLVDQKGHQTAPYLAIAMIAQYYDNLLYRRDAAGQPELGIGREKESLMETLRTLILPGT